jgi:hypothetical protein
MWNSETFYWLDPDWSLVLRAQYCLQKQQKKRKGGKKFGGGGGRNRRKLNFLRSDVGAICEPRCELVQ